MSSVAVMHDVTFWNDVLHYLETKVSRPTFELFIKRIMPVSYGEGVLYVDVPSSLSMGLLDENRAVIEGALLFVTGEHVNIIARHVDMPAFTVNEAPPEPPAAAKPVEPPAPAPAPRQSGSFLNPMYTFDNFVVGQNNRLCHAAAHAVAEAPGRAYNPLFIYGGVGLGKTHLMQAVGHHVAANRPSFHTLYMTADTFMNEYVSSIQANRRLAFRSIFEKIDLLLIDDIQFLAGKEGTQDEFFHIFNQMHQSQRQLIITCDRLPRDIPDIEDRLRNRFAWGLIADIKAPDYETRLAILHKKMGRDQVEVPDGAIELIASKIKSNIRHLEGTLNKVLAFSQLSNQEVTIELVEKIIREVIPANGDGQAVTIERIIGEVCSYFGLDQDDICGRRRKKDIVVPRQIAMFLCREMTNESLATIGKAFGKDHSTVLYSIDKLAKEMEADNKLADSVKAIRDKLES